MNPTDEKRKEAVQSLIRIAAIEAAMLAAAVGIWFATNNLTYLIGGIIGAQIIATPMFLKWAREDAPALKAPKDGAR